MKKMNKQEFLEKLRKGLCGLPDEDIEGSISFYDEMIDDRIEEGLTEEEAVKEFGNTDEIINKILDDTPLFKIVKEKVKPKRKMGTFEIILLILGAPIWLSILISIFAVILSVYISLWATIISLWAVTIALGASSFAILIYGIITIIKGNILQGIALLGACCILNGISIYFDYGCKWASKGTIILTKKLVFWTKKLFIKREGA